MARRGVFIVFEGCDRCGKTTQSKKVVDYLQNNGIITKHMSFPARQTPIGSLINSYLSNKLDVSDESIHLLFSANRWELHHEIRKLLESGCNLVVDRYSYSGVAFSAGKGLKYEWCKQPEVGLIKPDLVIYMSASSSALASRGSYGEERYENVELQSRVKDIYNKMMIEDGSDWVEVCAEDTIDNIFQKIRKYVVTAIEKSKSRPISLIDW